MHTMTMRRSGYRSQVCAKSVSLRANPEKLALMLQHLEVRSIRCRTSRWPSDSAYFRLFFCSRVLTAAAWMTCTHRWDWLHPGKVAAIAP